MSLIMVSNHGPLITSTSYWDSDHARAGKLYCSVNAGAIRVLLPPAHYGILTDMRPAKECVLSRGPWPHYSLSERESQRGAMTRWSVFDSVTGAEESWHQSKTESRARQEQLNTGEGIEIMWDDGSDSPFALHLTPASFDVLPAEPEPGREWVLSVWTAKDGRPHKSLERICHWRRSPQIPCLKPWGAK